jgi:putative membrane protein
MVPAKTPDTAWFLFMSGAIAICAMILPGISGAFILVLLGKYHYVLEAVTIEMFSHFCWWLPEQA